MPFAKALVMRASNALGKMPTVGFAWTVTEVSTPLTWQMFAPGNTEEPILTYLWVATVIQDPGPATVSLSPRHKTALGRTAVANPHPVAATNHRVETTLYRETTSMAPVLAPAVNTPMCALVIFMSATDQVPTTTR